MSSKILLVEDDLDIVNLVRESLVEISADIVHVGRGDEGLEAACAGNYDLIILDLSLPGMGGMDICRNLRIRNTSTAVLMLTARSEMVDKVLGLEIGADDYLTKPFNLHELRARVRAILRRAVVPAPPSPEVEEAVVHFAELEINFVRRTLKVAGKIVNLTATQFDLLEVFARNPGRAFSVEELLETVCGYSSGTYSNALATQLSRLRAKIEPDRESPKFLLTVKGIGYRFVARDELE